VKPYGELGLVTIADLPNDLIRAGEKILADLQNKTNWLARVDQYLAQISWDKTWQQMSGLINQAVEAQQREKSLGWATGGLSRHAAALGS
jgi:UDP-galactopyranose mutase